MPLEVDPGGECRVPKGFALERCCALGAFRREQGLSGTWSVTGRGRAQVIYVLKLPVLFRASLPAGSCSLALGALIPVKQLSSCVRLSELHVTVDGCRKIMELVEDDVVSHQLLSIWYRHMCRTRCIRF